jgi:hypothetical protein
MNVAVQGDLNLAYIRFIPLLSSIENCIISSVFSIYFAFMHSVFHVSPNMKIYRNEVRWPQWPILQPPRPIHWPRNCSFRYLVTCRLKCGVPLTLEMHLYSCFVSLQVTEITSVTPRPLSDEPVFVTGSQLRNNIAKCCQSHWSLCRRKTDAFNIFPNPRFNLRKYRTK